MTERAMKRDMCIALRNHFNAEVRIWESWRITLKRRRKYMPRSNFSDMEIRQFRRCELARAAAEALDAWLRFEGEGPNDGENG